MKISKIKIKIKIPIDCFQVAIQEAYSRIPGYNKKKGGLSVIFLIIFSVFPLLAQNLPFQDGEELNFNIYFKYGIVMAKAGTATHTITNCNYKGKETIKSVLAFKTTSAFDKIFKVRDTLHTYTNSELQPIYHEKSLNEGKTSYKEEMFFLGHNNYYSKVRSIRETPDVVKFDTILFSNNVGYDMLSFFIYARTFDFPNLDVGETHSVVCYMGRDIIHMKIKNAGQTILEKDGLDKTKTIKFDINIVDEAFENTKNALEIWISDDLNRIPVKIRAKLKIGAMEAELSSVRNLKYPFSSRIVIKAK